MSCSPATCGGVRRPLVEAALSLAAPALNAGVVASTSP